VPFLALHDASKSYGAVRAVRGATIELRSGMVRALLGENGAGKSTIVKMLAGVERPDDGHVAVDGQRVAFHGPGDAQQAGVAVIYQEPSLFPQLSVAENIVMGRHPLRTLRQIDRASVRRLVTGALAELDIVLDIDRPVNGLPIADQQIVEIAKALSLDARMLIMDEPTAALSNREVDRLLAVVRKLRDRGAAVLFVSHRLEEVFEICSEATVMRDGEVTYDGSLAGLSSEDLIQMMIGRRVSTLFPKQRASVGDPVLRAHRLTREGVFTDISFELRAGEIVGMAGLVGAGRSEVARAIFGIDKVDAGHVEVAGKALRTCSPTAAMRAGIAFVPEDRRQQGLVMDLSIERNATVTSLDKLTARGLIRRGSERPFTSDWADRLKIKTHRLSDPVGQLSGGNQQKVVLAKWLAIGPKVLIVDEPTRGIDVGAKAEVHRLLSELAAEGVAILMISSELTEVLGMADRVIVMHEGRVAGELARDDATEEQIMRMATGQTEVAA
jgi:rhamnose transport system ATP-binding protein